MANTYVGTALIFGASGTAATLQGLGALTMLQGADWSHESKKEEIPDASGNTKTIAFYDLTSKAVLDFIPSTTATGAGSITMTTFPTAGSVVTLTDQEFTPMVGPFVVDSCSITKSNTGAAMAKVNLTRYLSNSLP